MPLHGEWEPGVADYATRQTEAFEASGGAKGGTFDGAPIVVVTSRGAKTGKLRKNPVMRVECDGEYAVVASAGGASWNPTWYYNLTANPRVELQDRAVHRDYESRLVEGAERETWWKRAVAAWPEYARYQLRTARVIPIFVLTRVPA